jgi:CRP-like cAMP-binding protein
VANKGKRIINYGEYGTKFYIIVKGSVSVHIKVTKQFDMTFAQYLTFIRDYEGLIMKIGGQRAYYIPEIIKKIKHLPEYINAPKIDEEFYKLLKRSIDEAELINSLASSALYTKIKDPSKSKYSITFLMKVADLNEGHEFGELALINSAPRAATIIANENTYLAVLNKKPFNKILMTFERSKLMNQIQQLMVYPIFRHQTRNNMAKICKHVKEIPLIKGKELITENADVWL